MHLTLLDLHNDEGFCVNIFIGSSRNATDARTVHMGGSVSVFLPDIMGRNHPPPEILADVQESQSA